MTKYTCKRCGFSHVGRKNYENHINKKNVCSPKISNIDICVLRNELNDYIIKKDSKTLNIGIPSQNLPSPSQNNNQKIPCFQCEYCGQEFTRKDNLRRHEKKQCSAKKDELLRIKQELEILKNEKNSIVTTNNTNNINNTNNTNNNNINNTNNTINNNNVNINNNVTYGREDISYIPDRYCKKLLRSPMIAIPEMMKKIHFNPDHPENHTVKYTNMKSPYIQIRRNGKWVVDYKKKILSDMIDRSYFLVDFHYDDEKIKMRPIERIRYEEYRKQIEDKDSDTSKQMEEDCTLLLLNNRELFKLIGKE